MMHETWMQNDLKRLPEVKRLGITFTGDSLANKIGVILTDGGDAAEITGEISGSITRRDGVTITVTGSSEGNRAWIILPEAAYLTEGEIFISIREINEESKTTLGVCVGNVRKSATSIVGGV